MSVTGLCRLCCCSVYHYKQLFDENGQCNDVYDIATKYFDPVLLTHGQEFNRPVICAVCWYHINDFYSFQQNVYTAQAKLEDVKEIVSVIKVEEEQIIETSIVNSETQYDALNEPKDEENTPDINSLELRNDKSFSSGDEKLISKSINKSVNERTNSKRNASKSPERTKSTEKGSACAIMKEISKDESKSIVRTVDNEVIEKSPQNSHSSTNSNKQSDEIMSSSNKTQRRLENAAILAAWRNEFECELCHSLFANYKLLRKHFVKEHPSEKFYIICCQRKLTDRFNIVEHIRLHMDPNAFKCEICGRCSTGSANLKSHVRIAHTEEGKLRPFKCSVCQKSFFSKTVLKIHKETHESYCTHKCKECGKGFSTKKRRNAHEETVHNAERICDKCGTTVHGLNALEKHLLEHHGVQKRKWPCDQCGAELTSHSTLKRHKLLQHHDGSTVYICSDCGNVFTSELALRRHKKNVHQAERKFKCTICEKSFKFPVVLREHMATHTGEYLYQCPYCPKKYKTTASKNVHRKNAHPKEWAKIRVYRPQVDFNLVQNKVVM